MARILITQNYIEVVTIRDPGSIALTGGPAGSLDETQTSCHIENRLLTPFK